MALRQSTASGLWSAAGTWVGGIKPGAGDTFQINAHTVTLDEEVNATIGTGTIVNGGKLVIAFQMVTSAFGNITINNGGKLYGSRIASNFCRCAGVISANGAGAVDYGTAIDQISNPAIGAMLDYVCTVDAAGSRSVSAGANGAITFYGMTRTLVKTTLAAIANIGDTTITLTDDLALRQGTLAGVRLGTVDLIMIGQNPTLGVGVGAAGYQMSLHLVAGYNAGTKVVTLGDAGAGQAYWYRGGTNPNYNDITVARAVGTPVWVVTMNVGICGDAYNLRPNNPVAGTNGQNTFTNAMFLWDYQVSTTGNNTFTNCTFIGCVDSFSVTIVAITNSIAACCANGWNSVGGGATVNGFTALACSSVGMSSIVSSGFSNLYAMGCGSGLGYPINATIDTITILGCANGVIYGTGSILSNGTILGSSAGININNNTYINFTITYCTHGVYASTPLLISCSLANNTQDSTASSYEAENTTFASGVWINPVMTNWPDWGYLESIDDGGSAGAFRCASRGGTGLWVTATKFNAGRAGSFKLSPNLVGKNCMKQDWIEIEPGQTLNIKTYIQKDASMAYLPRVQIISPYADPLQQGAAVALAETQMSNSINTWETLFTSYKNTKTRKMLVILRCQCQNADGNVYFDPIVEGGVSMSRVAAGA